MTTNDPTLAAARRITHDEWQQQFTQLAKALGWQVLHVRKSIGKGKRWQTTTSIVGWPDCFCFHPTRGFAAVELKVGKDKPTPEQTAVLASLEAAGARCMVAYPDDLDALAAMLSAEPSYP